MSTTIAGHSLEEAWSVLNETKRLLATPPTTTPRVTARAAATTPPPDANEVFFGLVGETMDRLGCSRAKAVALVAAKHRDLHAAYIQEHNQQRRAQEASDRQAAARALARRNRR